MSGGWVILLALVALGAAAWGVHARWERVRFGAWELAVSGLLVALGTLTAHLIWIPTGVAKAFPVQHAINVLAGVLLGPVHAATIAFAVGVLRNLLGVGTLLAFPGGMIGAFLAGVLFRLTGKVGWAVAGELVGTGILGAVAAYPIARWVMGHAAAPFFYVGPFLLSSAAGSAAATGLIAALRRARVAAPLVSTSSRSRGR